MQKHSRSIWTILRVRPFVPSPPLRGKNEASRFLLPLNGNAMPNDNKSGKSNKGRLL